jgi:hypothetical protein
MATGFRKSKRLIGGVRLNVSKKGLGVSAGPRGARVSRGASGRKRVSLGWRGWFWRKQL